MKAAVLTNDRTLHFGDAADPKIGRGEVLVQTSTAGICGTDLHVYRGEFHGRVRFPAILGHEFGGVIRRRASRPLLQPFCGKLTAKP